jgi:hypothetical protein
MTVEYLDFEMQVSGKEGNYVVNLIRSPAGEAEGWLEFPCSTSELKRKGQRGTRCNHKIENSSSAACFSRRAYYPVSRG